jgi:hypothetical protein
MSTWTIVAIGSMAVGSACAKPSEPAPLFARPNEVADVDVAPLPRPPPPTATMNEPPVIPTVAGSSQPVASAAPAGSGSFFDVSPGSVPAASASAPAPTGPPKKLDATSAAEAIAVLQPAFQKCFRDQLALTPGISGTMSLDVEVKADGSVGTVKPLVVTGLPTSVVTCTTQVVQAAHFPPPASGKPTPLTIPIAFGHH